MVDGPNFNNYGTDRHYKKSTFKNGCWMKYSYIFGTDESNFQVRLSMQSLHRYTVLMI